MGERNLSVSFDLFTQTSGGGDGHKLEISDPRLFLTVSPRFNRNGFVRSTGESGPGREDSEFARRMMSVYESLRSYCCEIDGDSLKTCVSLHFPCIGVLNAAILNTLLALLPLSRLGTRNKLSFSGTGGGVTLFSSFWACCRAFRFRHQKRINVHAQHRMRMTGIIPRPSLVPKVMSGPLGDEGCAVGVSIMNVDGNDGGFESGGVELSVTRSPVDLAPHGDCWIGVDIGVGVLGSIAAVDVLKVELEAVCIVISSARTWTCIGLGSGLMLAVSQWSALILVEGYPMYEIPKRIDCDDNVE